MPTPRIQEIVFYDLETTIPAHDVIEFGAIVLDGSGFYEKESYSTLLYSPRINQRSQDYNGITPRMVANAPSFAEAADRVFDVLDGRVWAGHNIERFDNPRIREQFNRLGRPAPCPAHVVDTLPLLRRTFGSRAGTMRLAALGAYFGLGVERHRAIEDVRMNIEVLKSCALTIFLEENAGLLRGPLPQGPGRAQGTDDGSRDQEAADAVLLRLRAAIANQQQVWISYSRGTNPFVPRPITPIGWAHDPWLLKAHCHQSQTEKHFASRRILELRDESWDIAPADATPET